jgi:hypothetical protein
MSRVKFPVTINEIIKTCIKFFARYKFDGKDSPLLMLAQYNFMILADETFAEFVKLNEEIEAMRLSIRQKIERRDRLWVDHLKQPLMAGKNVLTSINMKTPTALSDYGFEFTNAPKVSKPDTAKTLTNEALDLQARIDALNALNEKTIGAIPTLSVTVNDVTKTNKTKV